MDQTTLKKALEENIIEELGLESLNEEAKINLLASVSDLIGTRVMVRVAESMQEADRGEYVKKLQANDFDGAITLAESKQVPFTEIMLEEVAKAKDELKARAAELK